MRVSRSVRGCTKYVAPVLFLLFSFALPLYAGSIPDWMEHWEFGINIDEDDSPNYLADLILPLHRALEDRAVLFVEPRASYTDKKWLTNLGIGYRQLVSNRAWLLGVNMFHDYETGHEHYRIGWGLEALSAYAELRSNFYLGLSPDRRVDSTTTTNTFEKAVDGFDVEAGMPVPYYSRLKLFGGFNWYNFEKFKNRYGWTLRTEYAPVRFIVIDGLVSNSTKTNVNWGMTVAFRIPLGGNAEPSAMRSPLRFDARMFPESDASQHLFRLVERHHEIVVETRRKTGTVSAEVLRGT